MRISPTLQIFTAASHSFEKAKNREIFFCYTRSRVIMEQDEWCWCREFFARGNSCILWENQKMLPYLNLSHMRCIHAKNFGSKKLHKIWIQFIRTLKSHSLLFWMIKQLNIQQFQQFLYKKKIKTTLLTTTVFNIKWLVS